MTLSHWNTLSARKSPARFSAAGGMTLHEARGPGQVLRLFAESTFDPEKARQSLARLREAVKDIKPNARNGATATVRRLRDGG